MWPRVLENTWQLVKQALTNQGMCGSLQSHSTITSIYTGVYFWQDMGWNNISTSFYIRGQGEELPKNKTETPNRKWRRPHQDMSRCHNYDISSSYRHLNDTGKQMFNLMDMYFGNIFINAI